MMAGELQGHVNACYFCGHETAPGDLFCGVCGHGQRLGSCTRCRSRMAPEAVFCGRCGAPSSVEGLELPAQVEEHLRHVTVLFVLLPGLQTLVELYDPEELKDLQEEVFRILTAEVLRRGGTIDKYMADSVLALFGVPVAHEDDPIRAVSAALGMLQALDGFNRTLFREKGVQLELKIGINSGRVIVGALEGASVTVLGDVVNTASRVEHAAPLGGILICDSTRRGLGERFDLKAQPPLVVKGKTHPLTVYRVLGEKHNAQGAGLDLSSLPLVGRDVEFGVLVGAWRQVVRPTQRGPAVLPEPSLPPRKSMNIVQLVGMTAPTPSDSGVRAGARDKGAKAVEPSSGAGVEPGRPGAWVSVLGDVGMGKARLLKEFQQYVERDPCHPRVIVTWGAAWGSGTGSVLRRLLEGLADLPPSSSDGVLGEALSTLASQLEHVEGELGAGVQAASMVRVLLGLAGALPGGIERSRARVTPEELQEEGALWLRRLVEVVARNRPLFILADDLHTAEDTALGCLEAFARELPSRVLFVAGARPTLEGRRTRWGVGVSFHTWVRLGPLTLQDGQALARALLGTEALVSRKVLEALHAFTGGVPFYLTEALREYVALHGTEALLSGQESLTVPGSLEGVLQSRVDRLPFNAGLTLRAASVVGRPFWRSAVEALLGGDRTEALELLAKEGLVERRPSSSLPEEEEYTFTTSLVQQVAAGNLLESTRRRYHAGAAEWGAARADRAPLAAWISTHFESAGQVAAAIPYLARAGEEALVRFDCAEAIAFLDRALAGVAPGQDVEGVRSGSSLEVEADKPSAGVVSGLSVSECVRLLALRGEALQVLGQLEEAHRDYMAAAMQAERAGEAERAAQYWYQVGLVRVHLGSLDGAAQAAAQGDRWLGGRGAPSFLAMGFELKGHLAMARGQVAEAQSGFASAVVQWRLQGDRWRLAQALHGLAKLKLDGGDFSAARAAGLEAVRLREGLGDWVGLAGSLHNLGTLAERQGELAEALAHYHRSIRLQRRAGSRRALGRTLLNYGVAYLQCGYLRRALLSLEESLQLLRESGEPGDPAVVEGNLGVVWLEAGEPRRALEHLQVAADGFLMADDAEGLAEVLAERASALLCLGELSSASRVADEAVKLSRRAVGTAGEARALQLMGAVAVFQGELELASEVVDELEWCDVAAKVPALLVRGALLAAQVKLETGGLEAAWARLVEATRVSSERDLMPLLVRARGGQLELGMRLRPRERLELTRQADAAWREYLARVEDPERQAVVRAAPGRRMRFWV